MQDSDVLDQEGIRAGDEMYLEGRADLVLLLGWIRDLRRQSGSKQLHGWNLSRERRVWKEWIIIFGGETWA